MTMWLSSGCDGATNPTHDGRQAFTVRDNDVAAIESGYHPVVGATGHSLYDLWVTAVRGRQMISAFDPQQAWVQTGR